MSAYSINALGTYIFQIRLALRAIDPRSQDHTSLAPRVKSAVEHVHTLYKNASHMVATALQSKFSSQFPGITGPELNRRYLKDGYIPPSLIRPDGTVELRFYCGHGFWDEPNSNKPKVTERVSSTPFCATTVQPSTADVLCGSRFRAIGL